MTSILFVCLGNICRSPAAEGIARRKIAERGLDLLVDSAGTAGYHIGAPPDDRMIRTAATRGYALGELRARQVEPQDFTRFTHVLAMDASNIDALQRIWPGWAKGAVKPALLLQGRNHQGIREVPDPYYGGQDGFDLVIDLLEEAIDALLDEVSAKA